MDLIAFAAVTGVVVLGSLVQVTTGVGGGFVMVPLLAMIDLALVPAPLIFASICLSVIMAVRERAAIDWVHIPLVLVGMLPGAVMGAFLISQIPLEQLGIVFGCVILLGVLITAIGRTLPLTRYSAIAAGTLSGIMGASSGIGAPLLALLYQNETGARLRGTLAILYTTASVLILLVLAGFNRFWTEEIIAGTYLIPGFILGYLIASRLTARLNDRFTRIAVLLVSASAAAALIWRSLPDDLLT